MALAVTEEGVSGGSGALNSRAGQDIGGSRGLGPVVWGLGGLSRLQLQLYLLFTISPQPLRALCLWFLSPL